MSFQQLKQPNLNVIGQEGLCLAYVTEVFGVPNKYPSATIAWADAQYRHPNEQPPTNVSVPVWFRYNGPDGHVAGSVPGKGIYSTSAQGDKIFPNVQALVSWMGEGMTYLGWSEDINGIRVVQPQGVDDMIPDKGHLDALFQAFFIRPSKPDEQKEYINNPNEGYSVLIERLNDPSNPEFQAAHKIIGLGLAAQQGATQLEKGKLYIA